MQRLACAWPRDAGLPAVSRGKDTLHVTQPHFPPEGSTTSSLDIWSSLTLRNEPSTQGLAQVPGQAVGTWSGAREP